MTKNMMGAAKWKRQTRNPSQNMLQLGSLLP
jgi:hypothetical protein